MANKLITNNFYRNINKAFWKKPNRLLALKVVIASLVQIIPASILISPYWGTTLTLGTVAAALAETDDHPKGRIKALFITIISFAITTFSVSLLKPFPILFGIGFIASTIVFVLIGGISERYRGISYGAILIGIYAMLGIVPDMKWHIQPLLLCSGALFYGLLSLFLLVKKPFRLLEEQLARGFLALSEYLEMKSKYFPVSNQEESDMGSRLAILNVNVVNALEKCKEVINSYSEEVKDQNVLIPYLQRFMLLQSLHERAASSHERYDKLKNKAEYKEILEGFSELLNQLSHATKTLANAMLTGQKYHHPVSLGWIISALEFEVEKLPVYDRQLLELFLHSLTRSHLSLKNLYNPEISTSIPRLGQDTRSFWKRIKDQLTIKHTRFRYAIRLSACFLIGYLIVISSNNLEKGEWIILTALFVCQPSYSETRKRLVQRIMGTLTGVVAGVFSITIMPTFYGQILLILGSVYFFFYYLRTNYSTAVIFITIYVLAGNNISQHLGAEILIPRTIDTIIGSALAFLAIRILWPNWQHKQLPGLLSGALNNNAYYLAEIWSEYQMPKADDYEYRLARRQAHKSDNALTLSWQSMQVEPKKRKHAIENAFTITYLNHVLLSYISAFGAQRDELAELPLEAENIINTINLTLKEASDRISQKKKDENVNIPSLKPLLIELRDKIDDLKHSKQKQLLRLLYNIAGVSNKLLIETENLNKTI